jgi:hypothetical protein
MMNNRPFFGYELAGLVRTAAPPCFAYPVFRHAESGDQLYFSLVSEQTVVGFSEADNNYELETLDQPTTIGHGSEAIIGFIDESKQVILGSEDELVHYFEAAVRRGEFDKFPFLKRKIESNYLGLDRENTRRSIIEKHGASTPDSVEYYLINDLYRRDVEALLTPELARLFQDTRIERVGTQLRLQFARELSTEARGEMTKVADEVFARTTLLSRFSLNGVNQEFPLFPDTKWVANSSLFDFPFDHGDLLKVAEERCFVVPACFEWVAANANGSELGIFTTHPPRIEPVNIDTAIALTTLTDDTAPKIFACLFSLSTDIIKEIKQEPSVMDRTRLFTQASYPASAILIHLRKLMEAVRTDLFQHVRFYERPPIKSMLWPSEVRTLCPHTNFTRDETSKILRLARAP